MISPEALQLSVGKNSKGSNNFRVLGEVMNQGENAQFGESISNITITNTRWLTRIMYLQIDIINPNKKHHSNFHSTQIILRKLNL
jgi:hypothetical protein